MWRLASKLFILSYVLWGGWNWYSHRPVHPPDGVLAATDPLQGKYVSGAPYQIGRWTLTPRASYHVTARILSLEQYHFDRLAALMPEDLALGWGPMSDNRILKDVEITQSNRFYYWRASEHLALAKDIIISHSANTHVIPENRLVARQLARLRPGQVVTLSGFLVDGKRDDGAWIRTSLVRTDTGAGACEILLVRDLSVD